MAYNKSERFQYSHERFRFLDPGAYQCPYTPLIHTNKVPFLSKALRETNFNKIWTHAIYFPRKQENIPNCTSLQSKTYRFSYEVPKTEAVKEILCDCDSDNDVCTCPEKDKDQKKELEICQGKVRRRLFTGPANNYSIKRLAKQNVPFYETRVEDLSGFYHGCKWSRRTSRREMTILKQGPGPADYHLELPPDISKICAEKLRAKRRKTSQQLRFIEIVQRRTIQENHPGPASYSPNIPKRKDFRYPALTITTKASSADLKSADFTKDSPGPADYHIPRDFDAKKGGRIECHAKLPNSAPFGANDVRFKLLTKTGPSPASYCINYLNLCHSNNRKDCCRAPFGSTSKRFKESFFDDDISEESDDAEVTDKIQCIPKSDQTTYQFKSKTIRMKTD